MLYTGVVDIGSWILVKLLGELLDGIMLLQKHQKYTQKGLNSLFCNDDFENLMFDYLSLIHI